MATSLVRAQVGDGYEFTDEYKPARGTRYAGVCITYRPALSEEVIDYMQRPAKSAEAIKAKMADLVFAHLVRWNVEDAKAPGGVSPVTPEAVRALPYPLLDWAVDCICGYAGDQERADEKN